jgi:uncharacterized OB-fold protein
MKNPIANWRSQEKNLKILEKKGRIISFSKIFNPPQGFGSLPYYVGLIDLGKFGKIAGQLVLNGKKLKKGAKVKAVLRIIGSQNKKELINYGIKFKLI